MSAKSKTKRGKDGTRDISPDPTPCTSHKSKRRRTSTDDEEDSGSPKRPTAHHSTSKLGHNGLRSPTFTPHNKPAELFRKDLISAMKMADSEPLQQDYFLIADPWRQDWEKGVQVPVNPTEIPNIQVKQLYERPNHGDFKIPRKYLHASQDETFRQGIHELTGMQQLSEQVVRYDLDDLDVTWLELTNEEREELGLLPIHEWTMERIIEALEAQCHEKIKEIMKTEEGLGIEYDEDIVCEVCRSPDSEETNEMVFCDGCDICVHQACYGIQNIPEGRWLCRTCSLGIKPTCILCPKTGGAMKSTKSGTKWAHVSCALWIPEVSIGCVEKMEPITKISNIPASRWALVCCVCKDRDGACIQCSVKTCKTAFHVTCAIFNGLEMKTILDESDDGDGVKLKAFCPRHSKKRERSHSDSEQDSPRKEIPLTPRKDLSKEEVANLRAKKLEELQDNFYRVVDSQAIAQQLNVEEEVVELVQVFWTLKRKTNFDKPMLMPKTEEADMLEKQQEDSLVARMKMFVHLRQDLERVRNLCYMISRREKTKRQYYKTRELTFMGAVKALTDTKVNLSAREAEKLIKKYKTNCLYEGYEVHDKPKVVSRLSFNTEAMVSSPHITDDTESVDSDSREVMPFGSRLGSRSNSFNRFEKDSEKDFDHTEAFDSDVTEKSEPEGVSGKVKHEKPSGKERSKSAKHKIFSDSSKRDSIERSVKDSGGKEKVSRSSRRELSDPVVKEEDKIKVTECIENSSKEASRKLGRPKSVKSEKLVELTEKQVTVEPPVKETPEIHGGKVSTEKTVGREKPTKHWKTDKVVKAKEKYSEEVKEDVEVGGGDADILKRPVRDKIRSRVKVKSEPETEFVDVMEVDPPVLSASFHPNKDLKVESPQIFDKVVELSTIFDSDRPRRSLRENRQQIEMPKVDVSPSRHSSPEITVKEKFIQPIVDKVQEVKEVKEKHRKRHGHRRHRKSEHRSSEKKRERTCSLSRDRKMTEYVSAEVNGVLRKASKYIVENSVRERVQNKLLKSRRLRYLNGMHDKAQQKLDTFFPVQSPENELNNSVSLRTGRILNEISPDKGKRPFENNLFGAHYTPKGSLSGYKIPKKGDSADNSPFQSQGSCEKVEDKSEARITRRKGEATVQRNIFADTGFHILNTDSDFSKDVELVSDSRGYRSQSPMSSAGTDVSDHNRQSPSREGTPRRVTRSQLHDMDENSVDSVHSTRSNMKMRLSDGWLRPAKLSS